MILLSARTSIYPQRSPVVVVSLKYVLFVPVGVVQLFGWYPQIFAAILASSHRVILSVTLYSVSDDLEDITFFFASISA